MCGRVGVCGCVGVACGWGVEFFLGVRVWVRSIRFDLMGADMCRLSLSVGGLGCGSPRLDCMLLWHRPSNETTVVLNHHRPIQSTHHQTTSTTSSAQLGLKDYDAVLRDIKEDPSTPTRA